MAIQSIEDLSLSGKKVFIRCDLNVSFRKDSENQRVISDDTRIQASLETINYACKNEAKVILASHLGRPKGKPDPEFSLFPVAERLSEYLNTEVIFPDNCIGEGPRKLIREMEPGQVLLLENLRFHKGETQNDPHFAKNLAEFADVYINDAFGTMHRAHASIDGLPRLMSPKARGAGFLVQKELQYLGKLMSKPDHPFIAILGGNKISDKISVIRQLLNHVDSLLIAGGMAYTFLKSQGFEIGKSVVENERLDLANDLQKLAKENKVNLLLPSDHVVADRFDAEAKTTICDNENIPPDWMALDIGPETIQKYQETLSEAKTIFWNGPAGVFEMEPFRKGTLALAQALADNSGTCVIGGGDSVAAIKLLKLEDKMTLISTGGGATLEFLSGKTLPGIQSIES